ncbi:isoamyl acetate-hydrolyzing esterase 1 homolog isoform X2 [Bubalus bubalis]|uniref:isoamyl acetate-hydrolyzing esterase 1 homolog isoform X2 n=1 Tax=Bubalus bubalis TaxID=89462 RepID=UPI001E1B6DDE|nr:isoamyl acetate-hydrolyzing esterase 1 homolog isoform X2 [Bubalus bubalis]
MEGVKTSNMFPCLLPKFSFQQGGWGASLADMLVRKCDVLNRGFSGYNTRWAKIILPRLVRKGRGLDSPVAVTIFFGANDSALKDENPKQHVPLEEFVANLRSMVQYLRSVDVPEGRLILITPPPLCEAAWAQECLQQGCKLNRLNSVVGEYARACLQVAQDCGADALDLWTLMQKDSQVQWCARSSPPLGWSGRGGGDMETLRESLQSQRPSLAMFSPCIQQLVCSGKPSDRSWHTVKQMSSKWSMAWESTAARERGWRLSACHVRKNFPGV